MAQLALSREETLAPMLERRSSLRYDHADRAQYCPANDLLPRDGRITNMSERGIGLLVQEPHQQGERITVSFSLENENDLLTATGVARWSSSMPVHGRWFPLGIEWLPFEETTRNRMRAYLQEHYKKPAPSAGKLHASAKLKPTSDATLDRMLVRAGTIVGLTATVILAVWSRHLHQQTLGLGQLIRERNAVITQMQAQTLGIQTELERAQAGLAVTVKQVARLDRQNEFFGAQMERLNENLETIRLEYARLRDDYTQLALERTEMSQKLSFSELERQELSRRLSSVPELRQTIRELTSSARSSARTVSVKSAQEETVPPQTIQEQTVQTSSGNGWIRVHEPQVISNTSTQSVP